jgi:hypothetical protein
MTSESHDALQTQDLTDQIRAYEASRTQLFQPLPGMTVVESGGAAPATESFNWGSVAAAAVDGTATQAGAPAAEASQSPFDGQSTLLGSPYDIAEPVAPARRSPLLRRIALVVGGVAAGAVLLTIGALLAAPHSAVDAQTEQVAVAEAPEGAAEAALGTVPQDAVTGVEQSVPSVANSLPSVVEPVVDVAQSAAPIVLNEHPIQDEAPIVSSVVATLPPAVAEPLAAVANTASDAAASAGSGQVAEAAAAEATEDIQAVVEEPSAAATAPSQPALVVAQPASQSSSAQTSDGHDRHHDDHQDDQAHTRNGQLGITQVFSSSGLSIPGRRH